MPRKTILLIADDPKIETRIKEILAEYEIEKVSAEQAVETLRQKKPNLTILDYDLKGTDGLQVFRQIYAFVPQLKVIMLSASGDISLAVTATKLGVADFLKKPMVAEQLREAVERNISPAGELFLKPAETLWLQGESPALKKMYADLRRALLSLSNLVLLGERGIEKIKAVEFIHAHRPGARGKLKVIDLLSFRRENLEPHFWAAAQEALSESPGIEDRCRTLYLENIEALAENFRASILEFFKTRKGETLTLIGLYEKDSAVKDYAQVEIPPLRERKEDLPQLLSHYLELYSTKHDKKIKGISPDLLYFLAAYDYPGNYRELECLLEQAILSAPSEILGLRDLPLPIKSLLEVSIKKAFRSGNLELEKARKMFEKDLYAILLSKAGGDTASVARLMDLPRTVLAERIENLSD